MTPTPNARWLGLIRCTCKQTPPVTTAGEPLSVVPTCMDPVIGCETRGPPSAGSRDALLCGNLLPLLIFGEDFVWSADVAHCQSFPAGRARTGRELGRSRQPAPRRAARTRHGLQASDFVGV